MSLLLLHPAFCCTDLQSGQKVTYLKELTLIEFCNVLKFAFEFTPYTKFTKRNKFMLVRLTTLNLPNADNCPQTTLRGMFVTVNPTSSSAQPETQWPP